MKIEVKRIKQGNNSTLSEIYIDEEFFGYGLEDLVRDEKVKGSTAIPAGTYELRLNTYGAMNARYKRKFPDMHFGMIEIKDVPNFKYVYIHIGNYFSDTEGCLLVGEYFKRYDGDYAVYDSGKAYERLYGMLVEAVRKGEVMIAIH
ncbi:hypothetical protein SAMN05660841_03220 [Sphingobacterium nematocida]|uniref:DUF5675 domain-containing protein n=1 Tax=Sphingobacterium nematocida TaxID=1513896 RepID=A0A1T5FGE8_9SPHI|nr:DUF5675 family protein [Sphingobacterium nematocida]SKB95231.1 hypothetical protein SAMN05660841_03220 [Sphingobacterium nematocida]